MASFEKIVPEIKISNNNSRKKLKSSDWSSIELKDTEAVFPVFETPTEFKWKKGMIGFIHSVFSSEDNNFTGISAFVTGEDTMAVSTSIDNFGLVGSYANYSTTAWILGKITDKETGEEKLQVSWNFGNVPQFLDTQAGGPSNYKLTLYYTNVFVDNIIETDVNSLALTMKQAKVDQEKLDLTLGDLIKVDQEKLDLTIKQVNADTETISLWPTEIWGEVVANGGILVPKHEVDIFNDIGKFTFYIRGNSKASTLIKFKNGLTINSAELNTKNGGGRIDVGNDGLSGTIELDKEGMKIETYQSWDGFLYSDNVKATVNGVVYGVTFTNIKPTKETK